MTPPSRIKLTTDSNLALPESLAPIGITEERLDQTLLQTPDLPEILESLDQVRSSLEATMLGNLGDHLNKLINDINGINIDFIDPEKVQKLKESLLQIVEFIQENFDATIEAKKTNTHYDVSIGFNQQTPELAAAYNHIQKTLQVIALSQTHQRNIARSISDHKEKHENHCRRSRELKREFQSKLEAKPALKAEYDKFQQATKSKGALRIQFEENLQRLPALYDLYLEMILEGQNKDESKKKYGRALDRDDAFREAFDLLLNDEPEVLLTKAENYLKSLRVDGVSYKIIEGLVNARDPESILHLDAIVEKVLVRKPSEEPEVVELSEEESRSFLEKLGVDTEKLSKPEIKALGAAVLLLLLVLTGYLALSHQQNSNQQRSAQESGQNHNDDSVKIEVGKSGKVTFFPKPDFTNEGFSMNPLGMKLLGFHSDAAQANPQIGDVDQKTLEILANLEKTLGLNKGVDPKNLNIRLKNLREVLQETVTEYIQLALTHGNKFEEGQSFIIDPPLFGDITSHVDIIKGSITQVPSPDPKAAAFQIQRHAAVKCVPEFNKDWEFTVVISTEAVYTFLEETSE